MDPITMAVITILGKYAIDKGVELAKEVGPKAVEVVEKLFQRIAERFKSNPADAQNLGRFEKKPEDYKASVADSLAEYMKDPVFAEEIKQLLAQYRAAVPAGTPGTTTLTQIAGDNAIQFGQVAGDANIKINRQSEDKPG